MARVDEATADPDRKMIVVDAMARRLSTHRNRLLLLRRQTGEPYGRIFVAQLEAAGRSRENIVAELQAVLREADREWNRFRRQSSPEGGAPRPRPVLYVGAGIDHNAFGNFYTLVPEIGIETRRFAVAAGVPWYYNSASGFQAGGAGDAYLSGFVRGLAGRYELAANLVVGFATGDRDRGLGAGKTTVDAGGSVQRRFERWRVFVKAGAANYVFNNIGYQRPFISTGSAAHVTAGAEVRPAQPLSVGAGGFGVWPWGTQTVHSRMLASAAATAGGSHPGHHDGQPPPRSGPMMPNVRAGAGAPFYSVMAEATLPGADLRDRGPVAWANWQLTPAVSVHLSVARSFPFELTTVSAGMGFDLWRLLLAGRRF